MYGCCVFGVDENEHAPGICEELVDRAFSHALGCCVYGHDGSKHMNVRGEGLIQECSMACECDVYSVPDGVVSNSCGAFSVMVMYV